MKQGKMKNRFSGTMTGERFATECRKKLHEIKERMTAELSSRFGGVLGERRLRQVINEADALAAMTPFPALILPTLAEEKVRAASDWQMKQRELFGRTLDWRSTRSLELAA